MTHLSLTVYLLTRRPRMAWARFRYDRRMNLLHREYLPCRRRRHLDIMAMRAEDISGFEIREPQTMEWMVASELLRAASASEYGQVLSDLYLTSDPELWDSTPAQIETWDGLWTEMTLTRGDHIARASVYDQLAWCAAAATGISVLHKLAATELSAGRRSDTAARRMILTVPLARRH
jgi:hypothetical protein